MAKKMKTYVLMLSREFPMTHPRAGEPTDFKTKKEEGVKKHTIRGNAELWEHRAEEINAGRAVLSVRQWSGKPYEPGSHQIEIARHTKLGTQRVTLDFRAPWDKFIGVRQASGDFHYPTFLDVAQNDGLSADDFVDWFMKTRKKKVMNGVILHFTDLRY